MIRREADSPLHTGLPHGTLTLVKLSEQQIGQAALLVASKARDVADCRDLLEMLGLIEPGPEVPRCRPMSPSGRAQAWKAAQKRLADEDSTPESDG